MISIYDFSILPFALGDVLTWNVKQMIKTAAFSDPRIDLYIYNGMPKNIHQDKYINQDNCNSYFADLLPAFYTNQNIASVRIFNVWGRFDKALPKEEMSRHLEDASKRTNFYELNKVLFEQISGHDDINQYFKREGRIPYLEAPKEFDHGIEALQRDEVPEHVIALHIRSRATDRALGAIEVHRDSNIDVWREFLTQAKVRHPNVLFVLMGKPGERMFERLYLSNVTYPRLRGWGLAQELSLIPNCTGFMGSCSGFAAMAVFTKTPYLITKLDERSHLNYGIPIGSSHLPFATPHQFLSREQETVELLMFHLERLLKV